MTRRIDAHQHYWNPARGDYGWMPQDDPILSRAYGPADLEGELLAQQIAGTVLVQAAPTVEETEYLLGIADATPRVGGVVGWIDFEDPSHLSHLERLAKHPKFKGVRPMIQDILDDNWMLRDDVQWAFAALTDLDLTFDALGFPRHIENFLTIFQRYPDIRAVIDHCMKPQIQECASGVFRHWADGITRIAAETSASCKLSGLVTEASPSWTEGDLQPYADHVLDAFGAERVMWGSDWPVCRLRCEYGEWSEAADHLISGLSEDDQARVRGSTATAFYRLA